MDATLAIILSIVGCATSSGGYITYRCYCNTPEEQSTGIQVQQTINNPAAIIQRQPTPPLEHALKTALDDMRNSNESDTEIDIKIHIQKYNNDNSQIKKE